uniref:Uncharacterized protein n=1 Tax=Anguilla anguilla TaxID=7936 RepID=A0A0E9SMC4_ANGAN
MQNCSNKFMYSVTAWLFGQIKLSFHIFFCLYM